MGTELRKTLIEILVVIAILAVLVAMLLAALSSAQKGSRDSRRKSDLHQYKVALSQFASDHDGKYPIQATETPMTSLNEPYGSTPGLSGKYMAVFVDDPNNPGNYRYVSEPDGSNFGVCANLERTGATEMFAVGPTISGERPSGTCTPQG